MDKQIMIINTVVLSDNRYILRKVNYEYTEKNGRRAMQSREVYDRGNGAVILLYNRQSRTVILTRQFRMPTYLNGNATGMLIEACAGLLDKDNPEVAIRRETEEETGYKIGVIEKVFESYMSPGSVTEILYFFTAEYEPSMKVSDGGGLEEEQEEIEVLELSIGNALEMVKTGEIKDAKTIMLLQHVRLAGIM
jgi:nudix-type nucleoside diphosphatase (YffH/AdpP family)